MTNQNTGHVFLRVCKPRRLLFMMMAMTMMQSSTTVALTLAFRGCYKQQGSFRAKQCLMMPWSASSSSSSLLSSISSKTLIISTTNGAQNGNSKFNLARRRATFVLASTTSHDQEQASATAEAATATPESAATNTVPSVLSLPAVDDNNNNNPNKKIKSRRVLSGVQPTGSLHLGNYLGAIRQWVQYQNDPSTPPPIDDRVVVDDTTTTAMVTKTENFFCVVDLHAITMPHDPKELQESTLASAALYLAAGIDPVKSCVFVQSHVPAHAELAWLLNCITPMNWLERMIQYKDKAKKQGIDSVGVGLFTYPTLMAADILLYQADQVPVGEDQRQHLELARDICRRFTDQFAKGNAYKKRCKAAGISTRPPFIEPAAMIDSTGGARVMSLTDGTSKMSKSDPNDASRINVLDPPDIIQDKIKKCKTDSIVGIEWDNPERPEATNLLNIYAAVQPHRTRDDIQNEVTSMTWGEFKPVLAKAIIQHLEPIQERYHAIRADDAKLQSILQQGACQANAIASQTLLAAKVAMGFAIPQTKSS